MKGEELAAQIYKLFLFSPFIRGNKSENSKWENDLLDQIFKKVSENLDFEMMDLPENVKKAMLSPGRKLWIR